MADENKKISLVTALVWIGASASVCAGAGWTVGRSLMSDELEQYKKSESWKIPEAIANMQSLSGTLDIKVKRLNDYDEIVEQKVMLEEQVKTLTNEKSQVVNQLRAKDSEINSLVLAHKDEISSQRKEVSALNRTIESLRGEVVTIKEGQALPVGHKSLRVGVTSTATPYNWVEVSSGNYSNSTMRVGDSFERQIGNSKYVVTLTGITSDSASFSYDVSEK